MPHRIDVELTSDRGDGTWTWRAAGAREPKGVISADLLQPVARVGDVLRAEVEVELDGITVLSVVPPRQRQREGPARLELLGPIRPDQKPASPEGGRPTERPPRRGARPGTDEADGDRRRPRRAARAEQAPVGPGAERSAGERRARRPERAARTPRATVPDAADGAATGPRPETAARRPRRPRLVPNHVHRDAALAALPPEQRPVAEQLLRGGIPAVRQALEAENARARAEHRPEIQALQLLSLAEELQPRLQAAAWRDRAEAAAAAPFEIPLRELRSVVAASDSAPHDPESRLLAANLREALDRRLRELREGWASRIEQALDHDEVVAALQASAAPPDLTARLPAELAVRLGVAAGQALSPELDPDAWGALLEAVAASPVRRVVKPAGLPRDPGERLVQTATQLSGRVPGVASLLGLDMPPPPGPPRPRGRAPAPR
jgi:hypothetical protein